MDKGATSLGPSKVSLRLVEIRNIIRFYRRFYGNSFRKDPIKKPDALL